MPDSDACWHLRVNGKPYIVSAEGERPLLYILRDELDLTGTKYGCGEAQCAACVVLVDGVAQPSCIAPLDAVAGREIITIEGIAEDGILHPVQKAFLAEDALQCGYCTPGMIIGAVSLLRENPDPTEAEIADVMQKHLCRCGTYRRIIRAVRRAAEVMADRKETKE